MFPAEATAQLHLHYRWSATTIGAATPVSVGTDANPPASVQPTDRRIPPDDSIGETLCCRRIAPHHHKEVRWRSTG